MYRVLGRRSIRAAIVAAECLGCAVSGADEATASAMMSVTAVPRFMRRHDRLDPLTRLLPARRPETSAHCCALPALDLTPRRLATGFAPMAARFRSNRGVIDAQTLKWRTMHMSTISTP